MKRNMRVPAGNPNDIDEPRMAFLESIIDQVVTEIGSPDCVNACQLHSSPLLLNGENLNSAI